MYKNIIFDLGGVMVDFDPKAYLVDRLCNAAIEEQVYDLTFGSEEWKNGKSWTAGSSAAALPTA